MDILDMIFPESVEPSVQRCPSCRRWFETEQLDFCRQCGALMDLACTRTCEGCETAQCATCYGPDAACTQCSDRGVRVP